MASKLGNGGQPVAQPNMPVSQPLKWCGSKNYLSGLQERREKCLAFNVNCHKCGNIGYFGCCCLAPVKTSEAIKDQNGDLGLFGVFFEVWGSVGGLERSIVGLVEDKDFTILAGRCCTTGMGLKENRGISIHISSLNVKFLWTDNQMIVAQIFPQSHCFFSLLDLSLLCC